MAELKKKHDSIMEEMDKARVEGLVSLMNEKNVGYIIRRRGSCRV